MPKTAAALLGVALVVFSIGFNTARYPMVWEMAGPGGQSAAASESAPTASPQPVQPENPAPAELQPSPAVAPQAPAEVQPVPEPTDKIATNLAPPAEVRTGESINGGLSRFSSDENGAVTIPIADPRKPLVPVLPTSAPRDAAGKADPAAGIHRLPPVDHSGPGPGDRYTAQFFAGAVAVYPSTANP